MATTTARRRSAHPMSYYRNLLKDMDKELYTPEEAYELTMKDIKAIYAYVIEGDTIKVVDACHAQNMR
ncbi:hypothetical protein [Xylanibacter brevis]|uniref:hypothetical protein n=1 Tax=Xylanibacter brevis TaxID=83231 RepID=UPI0004818836|nr:hypothetical protein [Xylanibacter brevis]